MPLDMTRVSSNAMASIPGRLNGKRRKDEAADAMLGAARIRAGAAARQMHGDTETAEADRGFADLVEGIARDRDLPATRSEMGAGGELVDRGDNPDDRQALALVNTVANPDYVAADASRIRLELAERAGALVEALDAADTIEAQDSLEKMTVHQMAAAHTCTMRMIAVLNEELESCRVIDPRAREAANIRANRTAGSVARLMTAYQAGMLALQRKRSGGQQHVKVTHIHQQVTVEDGGQAVVAGEANGGGRGRLPGGGAQNGQ
jgi:hypothetical protein